VTRRDPVNRAQRRLDRPPRERFATRELAFDADGDTCRGTLYLPGGDDEDSPVVVMAPGLGAERSFASRRGGGAVCRRRLRGVPLRLPRVRGPRDGDSVPVDPAGQRADYAPRSTASNESTRSVAPVLWARRCRLHTSFTLAGRRWRRRPDRRGPDADGERSPGAGVKYLDLVDRGRRRPRPRSCWPPPGRSTTRRTVPIVGPPRSWPSTHGADGRSRSHLDPVDRGRRRGGNETPAAVPAGGELSPRGPSNRRRDPSADTGGSVRRQRPVDAGVARGRRRRRLPAAGFRRGRAGPSSPSPGQRATRRAPRTRFRRRRPARPASVVDLLRRRRVLS